MSNVNLFEEYKKRLDNWRYNQETPAASGPRKQKKRRSPSPDEAVASVITWREQSACELRDWQQECLTNWQQADYRGTVKVVTGAGKTMFAIAGMIQLQQQDSDSRVVIVVPTIVLQQQWLEELLQWTNLVQACIALQGGGYKDAIIPSTRIVIMVLDTAARVLPTMHDKTPEFVENLLLIVDECHHAGSRQMRQIFQVPRKYSLGLSATPEREDEVGDEGQAESVQDDFSNSLLGKEIGPIVYEMTIKEAYEMGILPPFTVYHWGLTLNESERVEYDKLSQMIQDLRKKLSDAAGRMRSSLMAWVQKQAQKPGEWQGAAQAFIGRTAERKRLLYGAAARGAAVEKILKQYQSQPGFRAILFHESIADVEAIFERLQNTFPELRFVLEHSKVPPVLRAEGIQLFRQGQADVIVSARSLIEGFNVPGADVAIIVASSTSVRQRIQSMGRVLRKGKQPDGSEKSASLYVLYMRDTVDTVIYEREDWDVLAGAERNQYYELNESGEEKQVAEPPARPLPKDTDIEGLEEGDVYPGRYEGSEFSCDTQNNIFDAEGRLMGHAPHDLVQHIRQVKGNCGRFRVTPRRHYVLVQLPDEDAWKVYFVTKLIEPLAADMEENVETASFSPETATVGQIIPPSWLAGKQEETCKLKQFKGERKIERSMGVAKIWAKSGAETDRVLEAVKKVEKQLGTGVHKISLVDCHTAVVKAANTIYFLAHFPEGLQFS